MGDNLKKSWWNTVVQGSLTRLQSLFLTPLRALFQKGVALSADNKESFKKHLIASDFGPEMTKELLSLIEQAAHNKDEDLLQTLKQHLLTILPQPSKNWNEQVRCVILAGVNGAGKTTTIAKIARLYARRRPLLIPADTYRAAADQQLRVWSQRYNIPFFEHELSQPSAVVYQGLDYALKNQQLALVDTSGRLPQNPALMQELAKIKKVALKKLAAPEELRVVLVLDASQGQNLIEQVRLFHEALQIDSLIITKLDGSSKAGTIFQISRRFGLPIDFCGVGEGADDLLLFDPQIFVDSLWGAQ